MKKVNIILSTYNGEAYLAQQLDSLIAQTYPDIDVYIRDDGSTDHTVAIIESYCAKTYEGIRFHFVTDDLGNLNTWRSFFCCVMASGDADYYAYCDQDDVWHPEKIARAVEAMSQSSQQCLLYAAGYDICDLSLNKIGVGRKTVPLSRMSVGKAFFNYGAGLGQGFTLVFDRALKQRAFHESQMDIRGHDVWLWAVISGLHTGYIYDDYSSAQYRRHPDTVTPTGKGGWKLWKWRFQKFLDRELFTRVALAIQTYARLFGTEGLTKEDSIFLQRFGDPAYMGRKRFSKAFYPYRLKPSLLEELALRFAFLCGRV